MSIIEQIRESDLSCVAIFSGAGVDPDGLASQATMAHIIKAAGGNPISYFRGSFNRPQNRVFKELLGLNLKPEEDALKTKHSLVVSVDGPSSVCILPPDFIIDHHEQSGVGAKISADVRLIGACSSIVWELASSSGVDWTSEDGQKLATALAVGVMTDTKNCSVDACSELDYAALASCLQHKDPRLFRAMLNFPKPQYQNDLFCVGWENKVIEGPVLVAGLGTLTPQRGGVISDLAEKFCETDGVTTAVVFALVEGKIDISVRSSSTAISVDEFVRNTFGDGGGKRGAGRAVIELPPVFSNMSEENSKNLYSLVRDIIVNRVMTSTNDGARIK